MPHKILLVFGTRPEAIKMASVVSALSTEKKFDVKICVTAQHRQMLDQVLSLFKIKPDFDLNLMKPQQDLTDITSNILLGMRDVFRQWKPDLLIVHGDTTSAMATSIAAFYEKIPVAHVEAGLRTNNIYSPWPEEMNRKMVGQIASLHFAPTESARASLLQEGRSNESIFVTGNTVIDSLLNVIKQINDDCQLNQQLQERFSYLNAEKRLVLVTGHRRENFGQGFDNICTALGELAKRNDVEIVYPVHLNPNVQEPVHRIIGNCSNIHLIDPQEYLPFVYLMSRAYIILTDSGGIQEEAPSLRKPLLVMRETTERPEAIATGAIKLVGIDTSSIVSNTIRLLDDPQEYASMSHGINPYGDGFASSKICSIIKNWI